jgi:hypothetical protein
MVIAYRDKKTSVLCVFVRRYPPPPGVDQRGLNQRTQTATQNIPRQCDPPPAGWGLG